MKLITSIIALSIGLSTVSFAAEKKAPKATPAPAAETKKADAKSAEAKPADASKAGKPLPVNSKVDTIDAATKSFTHKNADGKEVKFVLSATAEIKNNGADAKFEDIKVGDTVAGLRVKKSDTEYEVTKITKFGVAAPRKSKAKAEGDAKPEEKKQ